MAGWVEQGTASAAIATATKAAVAGKQQIIKGVTASFVGANAGIKLEIKDDTTVIWTFYVHNGESIPFPEGIPGTIGNAVSAVLAAGSGASAVTIHGKTF